MSTNTEGDVNLKDFLPDEDEVSINEWDRLKFAKQILFGLALICSIAFVAYGVNPENKALENIFELIKIGALPLVTLVISFYFAKTNN